MRFITLAIATRRAPPHRRHDSWCSQFGRPVDNSRREANDRIAVALGLNDGIGEPFITDAIVRKLAGSDWVNDSMCFHCGVWVGADGAGTDLHDDDCLYALALAYVEANPE